ncbi:MAG: hypothetical protein JOY59_10085 [Candidatus Eremiobacteraeota bacterium]|nr:hypothetical protein [Candidatus Eremiobacteraeota bacterium]
MDRRLILIAIGALAFAIALPLGLRAAAPYNPFLVVDGDGWLTSNARHDNNTGWTSVNSGRPSFGLELSERNDLPFDRGTAGATIWVREPGCKQFAGFSSPCGWQLGMAVTQYRSIVVGGDALEVDGFGSDVYGRFVNARDGHARLVGMTTNTYADFSGLDRPKSPAWFSGIDVERDVFAVRRALVSPNAFEDLLSVSHDGVLRSAGGVAAPRTLQKAAGQWATRAKLTSGSYTFRYAAFDRVPVCVATSEGTARLRVTPSPTQCTVTSDSPNDSSMIDVVVIGNPS